jgi:hypothetical protein
LINSVKTCIAPWTESGELDERRLISDDNRSGYSSGQSELAMVERVRACKIGVIVIAPETRWVPEHLHTATGFYDWDQKGLGKQLVEYEFSPTAYS